MAQPQGVYRIYTPNSRAISGLYNGRPIKIDSFHFIVMFSIVALGTMGRTLV